MTSEGEHVCCFCVSYFSEPLFSFPTLLTQILLCLLMSAPVHDSAFVRVHLSVYLCSCPLQLLQHGSTAVLWEPDLLQVMEAAERKGLKELSEDAAQALGLLLTQVHPLIVCTHIHAHTGTQT